MKMRAVRQMLQRLDRLQMREKVIVTATSLVAIYGAWDTLLLTPLLKERALVMERISPKQVRNTQLAAQIQVTIIENQHDPNSELEAQRRQLEGELKILDERLRSHTVDLIDPTEMTKVISSLVTAGMELVEMNSEEPQPLVKEQKGQDRVIAFFGDRSEAPNIYRHTMNLTLRADFLDIVRYLELLADLPWMFSWESLYLTVEDSPRCLLRLRAHTLSLSQEWVGG
jgi:MSHA biogenesis protein MshJ